MSARLKMAREAVFDAMIEHGPDGHTDGHDKITDACLAAADAVMFDDAAVERAGRAVDDFTMHEYGHAIPEADRNKLARAVIAAIKGDDKLDQAGARTPGYTF